MGKFPFSKPSASNPVPAKRVFRLYADSPAYGLKQPDKGQFFSRVLLKEYSGVGLMPDECIREACALFSNVVCELAVVELLPQGDEVTLCHFVRG